jgi:FkbM family methyltransferase
MKKIFRIFHALEVLIKSKTNLFSFFGKSASVSSTLILNNIKNLITDVHTIIDVGANQGQFALTAKRVFPAAEIYCYEPVPETYAILERRIMHVKKIHSYNFALGNSEGEINFYSNAYSHASSALPVSQLQKELMPKTSSEQVIKVSIHKFDEIADQITFVAPVLLKLDVQGFEKEVLLGSINSFKKIDYLLFETSFVTMYQGEPLFDEMHEFVKALGFELIGPVGLLQTDNMQILQMDMLYKNINS